MKITSVQRLQKEQGKKHCTYKRISFNFSQTLKSTLLKLILTPLKFISNDKFVHASVYNIIILIYI